MKITDKKLNIYYLGPDVRRLFGDMEFELPNKVELQSKTLDRPMTDKEILSEWKPKEVGLSDIAYALINHGECKLLRNGWANIFYIRDSSGTFWAFKASWCDGRGWSVNLCSVASDGPWSAGYRALSQSFGSGTLETLDLDGAIKLVKEAGYKVIKEL